MTAMDYAILDIRPVIESTTAQKLEVESLRLP